MSQHLGGGPSYNDALLDDFTIEAPPVPNPAPTRFDPAPNNALRLATPNLASLRLDLPQTHHVASRLDPAPLNTSRSLDPTPSLPLEALLPQPPVSSHLGAHTLMPDFPMPPNLPTYTSQAPGSSFMDANSFYGADSAANATVTSHLSVQTHSQLSVGAIAGPSTPALPGRYGLPQTLAQLTPPTRDITSRGLGTGGIRKSRRSRKREPGWTPIPREERVYKICPNCGNKNHVRCLACRKCFMPKAEMGKSSDRTPKLRIQSPD